MSDAFIMRRGGSGSFSPNNAVLHVNAPVGSTITLAKGGVTVKVLDASKGHTNAADSLLADWYYSVSPSNYGEWTVTASDGTSTTSSAITIDSIKQYDVELTYDLYIIKNGIVMKPLTLTYCTETQQQGSVKYQASGDSSCRLYTELTDEFLAGGTYSKLVLDITGSNCGTYLRVGIANTTEASNNGFVTMWQQPNNQTYPAHIEHDISSVALPGKYFKTTIQYNAFFVIYKNVYLAR